MLEGSKKEVNRLPVCLRKKKEGVGLLHSVVKCLYYPSCQGGKGKGKKCR